MNQETEELQQPLNTSWMMLLAFLVGIIGGFGAIVFRGMIGLVHNLSFNGTFSVIFNANEHAAKSIWGAGIILVPVIGAVIVTWLTQKFAKEARGHGVPEVMDAIYYREGKIRPAVAVIKAIASSISIGTGGSVGREGPIIQIGAAFGSTLGQIIKMSARQRIVLIAAGAAAGIAATFNAPIGGLAFAMELMMVTLSAVNVALVATATVTATVISRAFLGIAPSFDVPNLATPMAHALNPVTIILFIPFGIVLGAAAALFIHSIYWCEDRFDNAFKNPYIRHMTGMFALGVMLYLFMHFGGHYYIEGVGYSTILDILRNVITNPWFLILLFLAKLLATSLTLGSGASGGVFSPSLFLGAALGSAFAIFAQHLFPGYNINPTLFAVAGMAAMVAGSTGAVLTAIAMTFEQTRDYADILPIMITVALTYAVRVRITNESIYTLKLFRRGHVVPQGLQAAISVNRRARHLMNKDFTLVELGTLSEWLTKQADHASAKRTIVYENDEIIGVIRRELSYLRSDVDIEKLIDKNFVIVSANSTWPVILRTMQEHKSPVVLVSHSLRAKKASDIVGIISQHELLASSHKTAQLLD